MGKIKKVLLVFMLCMVLFVMSGCGGESYGEFTWPSTELGSVMPQPDMELIGEVDGYSDDYLYITVAKVSTDDFAAYKELCSSEGFIVGAYSSSIMYSAKNDMGYDLSVIYSEREKTMSISLYANGVYGEFTWSDGDIAKLLPVPESSYGYVYRDSSDSYVVYVAQTTAEDYDEYVSLCKDAGFTVDYKAGSDYYKAYNENGYYLSLRLDDGDVMYISIDAPDEPEETEEPEVTEVEPEITEDEPEVTEQEEEQEEVTTAETEEEPEEEKEETSDDGIRPEVKEALDSYEEFMDEYIEFMEKYEEEGNPISMLTDYLDYISKYAETMEKLDALDDIEMTNAELAYYIEVTSRVSQKLLEYAD
ncbi:MAG: hypothetical protein LIO49_01795 [Ruminococcus sp.]|nr:hypothetical protein [Ruminococcus sp.]